MHFEPRWIRWARELQALAQTGLHFASTDYDKERYQRISDIAAQIFGQHSQIEGPLIQTIFAAQSGYATPKVDVRAAIFREDRILLVQERSDGLWTLPGGWADVNDSPSEAVEKEVLQESGFKSRASRLLALFDRTRHPHDPPFPFHIYKLFFLCEIEGGSPTTSVETSAVEFFPLESLPPLSLSRVTAEQIHFCFEAASNPNQPTVFD
ncbi:MAG: NUDIX hydrolase [Verrucomicrobia bacterium]|nr:NUDIX hydrolase [Verrucomicrobiota bacterium]